MENKLLYSRNVVENPCHMCMPMGAIIPFKGIEGGMVMIHGSQGCSTYMRRHIAEHYNEPIDVASSSLNEKETIYGGEASLTRGLDNLIRLYQPKLIGILSTCLAETIGEDIEHIANQYVSERNLQDFPLIPVATPGFGGAHSDGYFLAVKEILSRLVKPVPKHHKVNLIVPNLSPADLREIKRLFELMQVDYVLCPDFSDTLDMPFIKSYQKIPAGGTAIQDIVSMSGAAATIQMGLTVAEKLSPGLFLQEAFGVPLYNLPIPIGVQAVDQLMALLQNLGQQKPPLPLQQERGRLLDAMIDSHKYNSEGRCAIYGEPELVYAITMTCLENGVNPVVVASSSSAHEPLKMLLQEQWRQRSEPLCFIPEADFAAIRAVCAEKAVNLVIGHSDGRFLTERENIPLVRVGYPIHDRVGGQRLLSVGYVGTMQLLDRITNTLLENKQKNYRNDLYQRYYSQTRV